MKTDIILAGVGGQGILSIAAIIGAAAIEKGLYLKQSETHGMSQRGGAVVSHLRIADYPVASDLIPLGCADLILSVEPMEALRYLPYLSEKGTVVANIVTFENIPDYPPVEKIIAELKKLPNFVTLEAEKTAQGLGSIKASNMVMLGAASMFIELESSLIEKNIEKIFKQKGADIVNINVKAFKAGQEIAKNCKK